MCSTSSLSGPAAFRCRTKRRTGDWDFGLLCWLCVLQMLIYPTATKLRKLELKLWTNSSSEMLLLMPYSSSMIPLPRPSSALLKLQCWQLERSCAIKFNTHTPLLRPRVHLRSVHSVARGLVLCASVAFSCVRHRARIASATGSILWAKRILKLTKATDKCLVTKIEAC